MSAPLLRVPCPSPAPSAVRGCPGAGPVAVVALAAGPPGGLIFRSRPQLQSAQWVAGLLVAILVAWLLSRLARRRRAR